MRLPTFVALLLLSLNVFAGGPAPLWSLDGFAQPEAAVYSKDQDLIYLSNADGEPTARDHKGSIARISPAGKIVQREWIKGLNAPKGLALYHGILYVADLDELLEIDTGNSRIRARYKAAGAKSLSGVAVDGAGRVYVADPQANSIWRLAGTQLSVFASGPALLGPAGLLVDNGKLIVAASGAADSASGGYLLAVDLKSGEIEPRFAPIPFGVLLGLQPGAKGGYLVGDSVHGEIYKVSASGEATPWLLLESGVAMFTLLPPKRLLVPMTASGTLVAYPVE